MPELPEVETIKNQLIDYKLVGEKILGSHFFWPNTLAKPSIDQFIDLTTNQTILDIQRRAKYLIFCLKDHEIVIHLRMTGQFYISPTLPEKIIHQRAVLKFKDRYLIFQDTRKFGRWRLVKNHQVELSHIGPEPFSKEFSLLYLQNILRKSNKTIKPLLLDQTKIAGLGNIYVDESLFLSGIMPTKIANKVPEEKIQLLYENIKMVLKRAIRKKGSSLGEGKTNYRQVNGISGKFQNDFNVYGQKGKPCIKCKSPIEKIRFAQRGTHFCPTCQK